jgi:DNA-binding XRE family transcriptional regulator
MVATNQGHSGGNSSPSLVLKSFLELANDVRGALCEQVKIATDPATPKEERKKAEAAIAEVLRLDQAGEGLGQTLTGNQRRTPAIQAAREKLDRQEIAFADAVSRLMAEKQMTQAELAQAVGVSQPAISMILSRRCRPHPRTVGKIAAALQVEIEEIWPGKP